MNELLVGSTGFVGGNLLLSHEFSHTCHSTDISDHFGSAPDLCVYCGVPAAMFLANTDPDKDLAVMHAARENIRRIAPKKLVLVSSIAVYSDSRGRTEADLPDTEGLAAYGRNRLLLENMVREDFPEVCIVRLPALYGAGLKKNFLFDLHTITPAMLRAEKYQQLSQNSELVRDSYCEGQNGFFVLRSDCDRLKLREWFKASDFNALCFTDSRSRFQFYNLARAWQDISAALREELPLLNLCTPPVSAVEVYRAITGKSDWDNKLDGKPPFDYDLRKVGS